MDTLQKRKKTLKKSSPQEILDQTFKFSEKFPLDQMAVSASLMVVAKTIYLNVLGPEQTQDMILAFAENLEDNTYRKVTLH